MRYLVLFLLLGICAPAPAQEFANIDYLACDWGPAMTWSGKTNEPPWFSDTEEEIYFLKQVTRLRREKLAMPGFGGQKTRDVWTERGVFLCKMKADGTGKTELRELWHNPNFPIDTQGQSTWLDVNEKTRKIALSVTFAGTDMTGLWVLNLDGSGLTRIITPVATTNYLPAINRPSWTPDGQWIVFEEEQRGLKLEGFHMNRRSIAKCDAEGRRLVWLKEATARVLYDHPMVSPDGATVVYMATSALASERGMWLMGIDGANARRVPNPDNKHEVSHSGLYPAWSPDGKRIMLTGAGIVDVETGKQLLYGKPVVQNVPALQGRHANVVMPHWGKQGFLCSGWGGGIQLADEKLERLRILATSDIEEVKK